MTALIKYEAACRAIAECKAIDEVKSWADKAAAMKAYQRMAGDKSLELDAAEIRIRAERRIGELIVAEKAAGGLKPAATLKRGPVVVAADHGETRPTLASAGISKDLSSRAQKLAAVPEAIFEAELAAKRERERKDGERVSARLQAAGARELKRRPPAAPTVADEAHDDFDPLAELEKMQRELEAAHAVIKAAEADDLKAEAMKWRRAYEAAQRTASEKMENAARLQSDLQKSADRMTRIGRLFGERDHSKIAARVEAFFREHTSKAAA